jgi:hypothetical protein
MEIQPPTLEKKQREVRQLSRPQPPTVMSYLLLLVPTVRVRIPLVGRLMWLLMYFFSFCTSLSIHKKTVHYAKNKNTKNTKN